MPRILLVEDDVDVRFIIEHSLIDAGYTVDAIGTMGGGIELLRSFRFDLVITDGRLPDGTGIAVADEAAATDVKALIITAYAFTLPVEPRHHYEILLKPLRPAEIVAAVDRVLGL